jgi:transposase
LEALVRARFLPLALVMDERVARLWAAAEARTLGRGGAAMVSRATGMSERRIRVAIRELEHLEATPPAEKPRSQRVRKPGGGRPTADEAMAGLAKALESLVAPSTRGDPESPLRWTTKSLRRLAEELAEQGFVVTPKTVAVQLRRLGYSLQAAKKTVEGAQHPDRDAQFKHINQQAAEFIERGLPVVSVDTKKKELVGNFKNAGREWQPEGKPVRTNVHDFPSDAEGKAIPYGIFDVARNEAWVSVGMDHDTADFAVASLTTWWRRMGKKAYPDAKELLITADAGGSNSYRSHMWKARLQEFAEQTGLTVRVSHFPPGTSKWNKIEHRLFSQIAMNWRGRPLTSYESIVSLIAATTNQAGLRVRARLDRRRYPTGLRVPRHVFRALAVAKQAFHGEWNYSIAPRYAH